MKTITRKDTNVSLYLYPGSTAISMNENETIIGDPPELIIADCNTNNAVLYAGVSDPENWQGWKYLYTDADGWVLNPNWNPPV